MLARGAYRCDCGPDCDGLAAACCETCCPGRRQIMAQPPLVRLGAAASRWARQTPGATYDGFLAYAACAFLPAEHAVIRESIAFVAAGG